MPFLRILWILAIILCALSLIWFVLGTTANFQRPLGLVSTFRMIYLGIPAVLLIIFVTRLLLKGVLPSSAFVNVAGVVLLLLLSVTLFRGVNTQGWLTESVRGDIVKTTKDLQYEYKIELINIFQKNSRARLYVKSTSTGEEKRIPVQIKTNEIVAYSGDNWGGIRAGGRVWTLHITHR